MSADAFEEVQRLFGADHVAVASEYVFADLAELDAMTAGWHEVRDALLYDRDVLTQARNWIQPPADDDMSRMQPLEVVASLDNAIAHNEAMGHFAQTYIDKLAAAREQYGSEDTISASRLRSSIDGD